jgi:hypothetical protein
VCLWNLFCQPRDNQSNNRVLSWVMKFYKNLWTISILVATLIFIHSNQSYKRMEGTSYSSACAWTLAPPRVASAASLTGHKMFASLHNKDTDICLLTQNHSYTNHGHFCGAQHQSKNAHCGSGHLEGKYANLGTPASLEGHLGIVSSQHTVGQRFGELRCNPSCFLSQGCFRLQSSKTDFLTLPLLSLCSIRASLASIKFQKGTRLKKLNYFWGIYSLSRIFLGSPSWLWDTHKGSAFYKPWHLVFCKLSNWASRGRYTLARAHLAVHAVGLWPAASVWLSAGWKCRISEPSPSCWIHVTLN